MSKNEKRRPILERAQRPLALVAGLGAVAAGTIALADKKPGRPSTQVLQEQSYRMMDRSTGCYDFDGKPPVLTNRYETVDTEGKRRIIEIPISDSSTHKPGQDSWANTNSTQEVDVVGSGFRADYPVLGGERLQAAVPGVIAAAPGTTPSSTEYNLELGAATEVKGPRVANIYYDAFVSESNGDISSVVTGERLCGQIAFTVGANGNISDLHALPPTDEVGRLHIINNPNPAVPVP
jgi:hypothetical protein